MDDEDRSPAHTEGLHIEIAQNKRQNTGGKDSYGISERGSHALQVLFLLRSVRLPKTASVSNHSVGNHRDVIARARARGNLRWDGCPAVGMGILPVLNRQAGSLSHLESILDPGSESG